MRNYNVHEAVKLLDKYYITDSIQMVTRWLRERKIAGVPSSNRKNGWIITEEELFAFIEEKRPGLPQIMSVYEDYIKNLTIEKNEESRNEYTDGEAIHQVEINKQEKDEGQYSSDLVEQNQSLEEMVQQLLEEHSLLNQRMVEVIAQNQDLIEENKTLLELYEMMDMELKEMKDQNRSKEKLKSEEDQTTKKTVSNTKGKAKQTIKLDMPFKSFCTIADEAIEESNKEIEKSKLDTIYKEVYGQLCENEKIKGELLSESGSIKCPYSNKQFKQPKRFIKHAVQMFIERQKVGEQETLEMLS